MTKDKKPDNDVPNENVPNEKSGQRKSAFILALFWAAGLGSLLTGVKGCLDKKNALKEKAELKTLVPPEINMDATREELEIQIKDYLLKTNNNQHQEFIQRLGQFVEQHSLGDQLTTEATAIMHIMSNQMWQAGELQGANVPAGKKQTWVDTTSSTQPMASSNAINR